ncbi:DUF6207 family protein [Streptomyces sp. NPDC051636]|uniref:DUF6207 family protein n=1 Tax=Streptomyces sp. NPDC051636 TaxID=3365663 RepID=UPI0037993374
MRCGRWATATTDHTTQDPGQPGARPRCYLNVRQELHTAPGKVLQCADLPWSSR